MTNQDQGPGQDEDAGDAAQAFEALRQSVETMARGLSSEMVVIRKGLESAFEQIEALQPPPDYGADLGRMLQQIEAVAASPLLRQGAEHQAAVIERAGRGLVQPAVDQLERQAGDLDRIAGNLGRQLGSARQQRDQARSLWSAAITGAVAGALLVLFLPRILPTAIGAYAASFILSEQPWQAGAKLMHYASTEGWSQMTAAHRLVRDNAEPIGQCQKAAVETKREQRCSIGVRPAGP